MLLKMPRKRRQDIGYRTNAAKRRRQVIQNETEEERAQRNERNRLRNLQSYAATSRRKFGRMVVCFAAYCSHRSGREKCSQFRFPRDPKKYHLWIRLCRRADKKPDKDPRLCSCHFKDGKKENGPTIFFYREGKQLHFPDPEKRYRQKVLTCLEDVSSSNGSPSLNLAHHFLDSERKQNFLKKNAIEGNKIPSTDKNVDIVKIKDEIVSSSSDISESDSNSEGIPLIPIKIGNSIIYSYLPATTISSDVLSAANTTKDFLLTPNRSENTPLTITNCVPSTTFTPADVPFMNVKLVNSPSIVQSTIKIESEETLSDNLESVQENNLHESDIDFEQGRSSDSGSSIKIKSEETLSSNLKSVQENNLHEGGVDFEQDRSSDSGSEMNISSKSEQIDNVTHAEALYATKTLLHYMMNQDYVNSSEINLVLSLARKIKKHLSTEKENKHQNL